MNKSKLIMEEVTILNWIIEILNIQNWDRLITVSGLVIYLLALFAESLQPRTSNPGMGLAMLGSEIESPIIMAAGLLTKLFGPKSDVGKWQKKIDFFFKLGKGFIVIGLLSMAVDLFF